MALITAQQAKKIYEESTQYVLLVLDGLSKRIEEAAKSSRSLEIGPQGHNSPPFHKELECFPLLSDYYKMTPAQQQIYKSLEDAGYKLKSVDSIVEVGGGFADPDPPREERIQKLKISW